MNPLTKSKELRARRELRLSNEPKRPKREGLAKTLSRLKRNCPTCNKRKLDT